MDPCAFRSTKTAPEVKAVERPSTWGMEVIVKGPVLKDRANTATHKRMRQGMYAYICECLYVYNVCFIYVCLLYVYA